MNNSLNLLLGKRVAKSASFVEKSISDKLVLHGHGYGIFPSEANKVVDSLLAEAWRVATQKENRELTRVRFLRIFEAQTTQTIPTQQWRQYQQMLVTTMGSVGAGFIGGSSDITIQSQSPIQNMIPPLYPDVVPRPELLASIEAKLQSEGIAVIQGGAGRGKTTLAKLTANTIRGSCFWLNFIGKDPSQVTQLLQQLAIAISNQSSQINVVLDDLDLRPQELQQYQEVLGVVVYRGLERGAKLLITSQHKLPNNFRRRLDMSRPVVIHVPDFTISEIEQFAQQLGCPADDAKDWGRLTQLHTGGHPMLVHALFAQLQQEDWKRDIIESILQPPQELVDEREQARQLLLNLPEDQREFLYRLSLMSTEFRQDYALNIGEILEPIPHPGDIFSQLIGPWVDSVDETYYT